jgi:hypothetical protein
MNLSLSFSRFCPIVNGILVSQGDETKAGQTYGAFSASSLTILLWRSDVKAMSNMDVIALPTKFPLLGS